MEKNKNNKNIFLSFSFKISIIFSLVTLFVSIIILYYFYYYSKQNILNSLQNRIKDIGKTGIFLFEESDLEYLKSLDNQLNKKLIVMIKEDKNLLKEIKKTPPGETYEILTEEQNKELYNSKQSQSIVQILRKIKAGSSPQVILKKFYKMKFYDLKTQPFLRFIYILTTIPYFDDYSFVKFLFDADMEEEDINQNGKIDSDEEGLFIGTIWNIVYLPSLQNAFKLKKIQCENEFYEDQWGIWLSCYIPIFDYNNHFIGIMGLDLDVHSEYNKLNQLKNILYILLVILLTGIFILSYITAKIFLKPIIKLSEASIQVANKNFNIELIPSSKDEVGILTENFNLMVKEIKQYSENLEELVNQRTKQLQEALKHVQDLKEKQDGDYFLTSLLIEPLVKNLNKSRNVITDFFIKQKKEFVFKDRKKEIGGDICITGNLRFLNQEKKIERWVFFFNGDAMGKSLQGAGGSLVMGVIVNTILSRSAANDKIQNIKPIQWFKETVFELQSIFSKFDGSMMVSAAMGILNEHTGEIIYANFEHPYSILYRNHKAVFLEEDNSINYKFGFPDTKSLKIIRTYLQEGDVLILASDGRDDIILKETGEMNRDDTLILKIVEKSLGRINKIYENLTEIGQLTDDLSFLRLEFLQKVPSNNDALNYIKKFIQNNQYEQVIQFAKELDLINEPICYYYISYAYFKNKDIREAKKWLEPVKDILKHPVIEKYKLHLFKLTE
ncbi:MAG: hypothetical protein KatS3mg129_2592 [Leptospiraceae bacterium]|nr:MAG: hypothetical protein KatS3mg129_2592 [Leptospiraceae bacterium]